MPLYSALLDRLKNQQEAIAPIIHSVDKTRVSAHPMEGKWSIYDNIAHLANYQPVFIDRVNTILTQDLPFFERYSAENDPAFERWRDRALTDLIKTLNADRQILFNLITSLSDEQLNRAGHHKKYGRLTVIQWTEFFLLHEAHHIFTIFQLANDTETK